VRRFRGSAGQASVEVVALVPLLVLVAAAAILVLAAGRAAASAAAGAEAGALALIQGRDAVAAARRAAPGSAVVVRGGRVRVTVRPPILADLLRATATADAGPHRPSVLAAPQRGGDGAASRPVKRGSRP
jgi:hypothetical protein